MSAADCDFLASATPCPDHIESASISPERHGAGHPRSYRADRAGSPRPASGRATRLMLTRLV